MEVMERRVDGRPAAEAIEVAMARGGGGGGGGGDNDDSLIVMEGDGPPGALKAARGSRR
jgi:hypothetical protein